MNIIILEPQKTESDLNRIGGAYNQYVGSLIEKQIVLKEFVNQPYDYPVGMFIM